MDHRRRGADEGSGCDAVMRARLFSDGRSGQLALAVELPAKYRRPLVECDSVSALADDVTAVSLATRELTTECKSGCAISGCRGFPSNSGRVVRGSSFASAGSS